ncbi:mobile mystery protein A [Sphingomonas koreensis]|nr:mobile mystery protein A [Sphingomonas koreensis]
MIKERQAELARKNLENKLAIYRGEGLVRPRGGWVRALRDALGMTSRQLARRMGVSQSRVVALEKAEVSGSTTLKSLRDAAEALDCHVVYALVPKMPLNDLVRDRARQKAHGQHAQIAQGMLLENQALTVPQTREEIDRLTDEILAEPLRYLWEDE